MLQNAKLELRKSKRKDYYKVLGIDKNANEEEVRISCCRASLQVTYLSGTNNTSDIMQLCEMYSLYVSWLGLALKLKFSCIIIIFKGFTKLLGANILVYCSFVIKLLGWRILFPIARHKKGIISRLKIC